MNGGYIMMPERLSNELMGKFYNDATSATGNLNGLTEVCKFLYDSTKIGKPIVMSGFYTVYPYCCYISIGFDKTFVLSKGGEAFVMQITNMSKGIISYHAIDRA